MEATAVHATSVFNSRRILAQDFRPGSGAHNFLGHGVYVYRACRDPATGLNVAIEKAEAVARKKYGDDIVCLILRVSLQNGVDLQHPPIRQALRNFTQILDKRIDG